MRWIAIRTRTKAMKAHTRTPPPELRLRYPMPSGAQRPRGAQSSDDRRPSRLQECGRPQPYADRSTAYPDRARSGHRQCCRLDPADFLALFWSSGSLGEAAPRPLRPGDGSTGQSPIPTSPFFDELARLAGKPLDDLSPEHRGVIREVVADQHPRRRWLTIGEASSIDVLREIRPDLMRDGLSYRQIQSLRNWALKLD